MAVNETNKLTKGKLVFKKEGDDGELRQSTRTFSNLTAGAESDALHSGLSAVAGLLDVDGVSVVRVDESTLVEE